MNPPEKGDLDEAKLKLDGARLAVRQAEKLLTSANRFYAEAWAEYEEVARMTEAIITVPSHHLEGGMTMERRARFCDITGEEIAPGTGAKLVLTQDDKRWEADVADSALAGLLATLNDPEEKKKRGRPTADAADAKKEPAAA